jgi:toxin ParE1/3/4
MKIVWRPRAEADFSDQIDYVRLRSPRAASRLIDAVQRVVDLLEQFPEIGRPTPRPDVRELVVTRTPYIIVYRIRGDEVIVLRLFQIAQKRD